MQAVRILCKKHGDLRLKPRDKHKMSRQTYIFFGTSEKEILSIVPLQNSLAQTKFAVCVINLQVWIECCWPSEKTDTNGLTPASHCMTSNDSRVKTIWAAQGRITNVQQQTVALTSSMIRPRSTKSNYFSNLSNHRLNCSDRITKQHHNFFPIAAILR